ncbi:MAG: hypothetical protein KGJ23_12100 [Euryarchaeota archaeon]|nr:hypothetical protein [Euryarchaeota archaeon]MDE1837339.1 hypothetical protein [Euryarchaeota archaeon]MDE1880929.1 hypothetical protein [Euryarchaeota archaeon]MDE2045617.1 hypothetical protein [Thermoplasmata archaeon]
MTTRKPIRLCPECGDRVRPGKKEVIVHGVSLGLFPVHECPRCGETSLTPRGWASAEKAAKAKGLFGLGNEVGATHIPPANGKAHA